MHKPSFKFHYRHYEFLVMPFGIDNVPSTFHSCMNHIFWKKLGKFMSLFFDDLLIYNKTWEKGIRHLDEILGIMGEHSL